MSGMEEGKRKEWEKRRDKKKYTSLIIMLSISLFFSPYSFISMPQDTQEPCTSLFNDMILMILQLADENMLSKSGNAVYLRMKKELEDLRCVATFLLDSGGTDIS